MSMQESQQKMFNGLLGKGEQRMSKDVDNLKRNSDRDKVYWLFILNENIE